MRVVSASFIITICSICAVVVLALLTLVLDNNGPLNSWAKTTTSTTVNKPEPRLHDINGERVIENPTTDANAGNTMEEITAAGIPNQ